MFKRILRYMLFRLGKPTSFHSIESMPWAHPFLTRENISAFRRYSEQVQEFAFRNISDRDKPLSVAFSVNMAQNMYKWARLAQSYGASSTLYCHPLDTSAISQPEWEEFDGESEGIFNGTGFLAEHQKLITSVPSRTIPMGDQGLLQAWNDSRDRNDWSILHNILAATEMFPEAAIYHPGCYPYWDWARAMEDHDVIYTCSAPISAYLSGRPYCYFSVGGDLQFDCGLANDHGMIMRLAVNRAKFIFVSNPHTLGHCRRLGFRNTVYLPYPMDSNRYCPGERVARAQWEAAYGPGIYVLTTSRIDREVKGFGQEFLQALFSVVRDRPEVRFVFLGWGNDIEAFRERVTAEGLQNQIIILPPVGKTRLIDYYRSCDMVLDQFVYGYYGATALEAASIGKPVIMKLRADQYAALYNEDVAPVENVSTPLEMRETLFRLIDDKGLREEKGRAMRDWLVRNHGEEKTVPLMLALLRLAADRVALPPDLVNPLSAPLTEKEIAYHKSCLQAVQ